MLSRIGTYNDSLNVFIRKMLLQCTYFQQLSTKEINQLALASKIIKFNEGCYLQRRSCSVNRIILILDGEVHSTI